MTRRGWGTVVYVAAAVVGIVVFAGAGSPWIAGKAYATATTAFALLAAIAIALAWEGGYRAASAIVAVLLAGGVLWSNVLAYHDVWLAPRGQLHELERIGDRFAGDGPALMTEYQPYGARHFLRKLDAEGAAELRARPVFLRNGKTLDKSGYADLDQFALPSIFDYRTLVIRRSPAESMPPSPYRLVWRGSTYDVWQRPLDPPDVKSHLPLGSGIQPGGVLRRQSIEQAGWRHEGNRAEEQFFSIHARSLPSARRLLRRSLSKPCAGRTIRRVSGERKRDSRHPVSLLESLR